MPDEPLVLLDPLRPLDPPPAAPDWSRIDPGPDVHQERRVDTDDGLKVSAPAFFAARSPAASLVDRVCYSALYLAAGELGKEPYEVPAGSNHTQYWADVYPPANNPGSSWAWCAGFACWAYKAQGCDWRGLVAAPYYCPSIEGWARARGWWKTSGPLPGDLTLYSFGGSESVHVGIHEKVRSDGLYQAIEGNTSSGNSGSQDDGGGVYRRARSRSQIRGWVDMREVVAYHLGRDVWDPVDGLARQRELADWGIPIDIDGYNGPDTAQKWSDLMSTIDDVLAKLDDLGRKVDAVATTASKVRQAVIPTLTTEEKIVAGTRSDELSAGALLRILLRRASRVNSITGAVNPDAAAQYDANLKAKTEAGR